MAYSALDDPTLTPLAEAMVARLRERRRNRFFASGVNAGCAVTVALVGLLVSDNNPLLLLSALCMTMAYDFMKAAIRGR